MTRSVFNKASLISSLPQKVEIKQLDIDKVFNGIVPLDSGNVSKVTTGQFALSSAELDTANRDLQITNIVKDDEFTLHDS